MMLVALVFLSEPTAVDLGRAHPIEGRAAPAVRFEDLDAHMRPAPAVAGPRRGTIATPTDAFTSTARMAADEHKPGSEYPRRHTLYMNFTGAALMTGEDNSAEDRSSLAENGNYPVFTGGEAKAIASVQALETDLEPFGVRVVYLERPPQVLPYTMAMIGGEWMDTQLDSPAGGVAAAADCGAVNQRRVVYVFADGGWSALDIAATAAQEAGHAWGLDHSYNCDSVMSYCAGAADKGFSSTCDELCELDCQLPASCRVTHEMFCGADSDQQNEVEELTWLFGSNAPDMEPPTVEILAPVDGLVIAEGEAVDIVSSISDDFGGYGWKYKVTRDGELIYDQVSYDRAVDDMDRPFLQFVNLKPGEHVFTVEAMDHAHDEPGSDSVTVIVEGANADTSGTGADSGTGESSTGDADDDDRGDETSSGGGDGGQAEGGDEGCSCTSGPGGSGLAAAAFALFAVRRRRLHAAQPPIRRGA